MLTFRLTKRIYSCVLFSLVVAVVSVLSQESLNSVRRTNHPCQLFEQNRGFQQLDVNRFRAEKLSPADAPIHSPLLMRKKQQKTTLAHPLSTMYAVDTAIVYGTTDTTRDIFQYSDNRGQVIEDVIQKLANAQWVNSVRSTYTHDGKGHQLSFVKEEWVTNAWENYSRSTSTYNAKGHLLSSVEEQWIDNQWTNTSRSTHTYDATENEISYLDELWTAGQWVNNYQSSYFYTVDGLLVSQSDAQWINNQWVNSTRDSLTFDAKGNIASILDQHWIVDQWVNTFLDTLTHDANDNTILDVSEEWVDDHWVNSFRNSYTYDAKRNELSGLSEQWINSQWVNWYRSTFNYDTNGNMVSYLDEQWSNAQWVNVDRYTYAYFQNAMLSGGTYETWENSAWEPADGYFSSYDTVGNNYLFIGYKIAVTYKLIVMDVTASNGSIANGCSLSQNYPNPFNPTTKIDFSLSQLSKVTLTIYDVLGREIIALINQELPGGYHSVLWDARNCNSGMYFYQLRAGKYQETRKLLLLK